MHPPAPEASLSAVDPLGKEKATSLDALSCETAPGRGAALFELVRSGGLALRQYEREQIWQMAGQVGHSIWILPLVVGLVGLPAGILMTGNATLVGWWSGGSVVNAFLGDLFLVMLMGLLSRSFSEARPRSMGVALGQAAIVSVVFRLVYGFWTSLIIRVLPLTAMNGLLAYQALFISLSLMLTWVKLHVFSALVLEGQGFFPGFLSGFFRSLANLFRIPRGVLELLAGGSLSVTGPARLARVLLILTAARGVAMQGLFLVIVTLRGLLGYSPLQEISLAAPGAIVLGLVGSALMSGLGLIILVPAVTRWSLVFQAMETPALLGFEEDEV